MKTGIGQASNLDNIILVAGSQENIILQNTVRQGSVLHHIRMGHTISRWSNCSMCTLLRHTANREGDYDNNNSIHC